MNKQINNYLKTIFLMGILIGAQACAPKSLILKDRDQKIESIELERRGSESLAVSYLAKELVSKEKQQITANHFSKTEKVKTWSASDYAISGKMIGDALAGSFGSATGDLLGSAIFAISLFGPDGSQDWIDRVFIPAEIDGKKIESAEDAKQWVFDAIQSKVERISQENDWGYQCIEYCNNNNAIYELSINSYPEKSLYRPEKIYVYTYIRGSLQKAKPDLLRDAATSFPVAWEDGKDAYFLIRLFSEPELGSDGNLLLERVENERSHLDGAEWITSATNVEIASIGHYILNSLYDSSYFLKGYNSAALRRVFYNGKIYEWIPYKAHDGFVREELLPSNYK